MNKTALFLSTVADDAIELAAKNGLGIEIAEYCTAANMDEFFAETDPIVVKAMKNSNAKRFIFHAPFNELFPAAIDPNIVRNAHFRLNQAVKLAASYGIKKLVVHSGQVPMLYYPIWFEERAILFWQEFLADKPADIVLCMENVLENEPELLCRVVKGVNDPRLHLCMDVGHANACTAGTSVLDWLKTCAPYIAHFHIHNNAGDYDMHQPLGEGSIDMKAFLKKTAVLCPNATYTIETMHAESSVAWLYENGFLKEETVCRNLKNA